MELLRNALDSVSGDPSDLENTGPASRLLLVAIALLAAAGFSALFGLAVGTTPSGLALTNVIKVPMIVVLSGLFALPMGALILRVVRSPLDVTQLWISQATGTLTASLVLAAVAPLVGLFYYSSDGFGGVTAVAASFAAIGGGLYVFVRAIGVRTEPGASTVRVLLPVVALVVLQGLAVMQLVAVASPILPETTPFALGVDGLATNYSKVAK